MKKTLILAAGVALGAALSASATIINIVVDEYGHGYVGTYNNGATTLGGLGYSTTTVDPFAAAHSSVNAPYGVDQYGNPLGVPLSYALGPSWIITKGDIRLDDKTGGDRSDLIRFTDGLSRLFFYSDTDDPPPLAPADVHVPLTLQNAFAVLEVGVDTKHPSGLTISTGADGYVWNATKSTDIGYITGTINGQQITGVNYYFVSDGTIEVPEPTTVIAGVLLLLPFGASTVRILRKKIAA